MPIINKKSTRSQISHHQILQYNQIKKYKYFFKYVYGCVKTKKNKKTKKTKLQINNTIDCEKILIIRFSIFEMFIFSI